MARCRPVVLSMMRLGKEARWTAVDTRLQHGGAAGALHEIVVGGLVAVGAGALVAETERVHEARVDGFEHVVAEAQSLDGLGAVVVHEHVGGGDEPLERGDRFGPLKIET